MKLISPDASRPGLVVENLAGARGLRVLFEGVSFDAAPGSVVELRGANGAGKSTLLRMLAGLTRPLSGRVRHFGRTEADCHFLGHLDAVKPSESAGEQAAFWARFLGAPRPVEAAQAALARVGLASRFDVPGRGLSAGQKRRLALTRLLAAPRPLWLLDEPFASLDTAGRALVLDLAREHVGGGGIVVAAVHGEGFAGANTIDLSLFAPKAGGRAA